MTTIPKVSNCCGAVGRGYLDSHGGIDSSDEEYGLCASCGDHCEYVCAACYGDKVISTYAPDGTELRIPCPICTVPSSAHP